MKLISLLVVILAVPLSCTGQSRSRKVFEQPCSVVFPAAENLGSHKPYEMQVDTDGYLVVRTGRNWKVGRRELYIDFTQNNNGSCTVTAGVYDGAAYNEAVLRQYLVLRDGAVFLNRLEEVLKKKTA